MDSQRCLVADQENKEAIMYSCDNTNGNQMFILTKLNEIRNYGLCLDAVLKDGSVKVLQCHELGGNQKWIYDEQVSARLPSEFLHIFLNIRSSARK